MEIDNQSVARPGGFWIRVVALAIDSIVISAPFGIITFALGNVQNPIVDASSNLTSILYTLLLPVFWNGYTVGKKVMGIQILKLNGDQVSIGTMLLRNLVSGLIYVVTFGVAVVVSAFMVAFRSDRRAMHDFIAGTYVKRVSEKQNSQLYFQRD